MCKKSKSNIVGIRYTTSKVHTWDQLDGLQRVNDTNWPSNNNGWLYAYKPTNRTPSKRSWNCVWMCHPILAKSTRSYQFTMHYMESSWNGATLNTVLSSSHFYESYIFQWMFVYCDWGTNERIGFGWSLGRSWYYGSEYNSICDGWEEVQCYKVT